MSKLPCMVMNYKLCISSHPGIIFWQWGCSWHAILLSRVLYRLNKNFETANMVNTQCRHSMARAHESLFCQSSAGVLTGQLSTLRIQWCVVRVCVPAISCFISIHPFLSPLLFNGFFEKSSYKGHKHNFHSSTKHFWSCCCSVCGRLCLLLPSTEVSGGQICSQDFRHIFVAP